jgi:hypothetical protein
MEVLFAFVLLVLVGAMVLLFAMLGELASRLPESGPQVPDKRLLPVENAPIGRRPAAWPSELSAVATADHCLLLVLSTACRSCNDVAIQLRRALDRGSASDIAVVVSTAERETGQQFVDHHGLELPALFIDEDGQWVKSELDGTMSPAGLVFQVGRLKSALVFGDLETLRAATARNPRIAKTGGASRD